MKRMIAVFAVAVIWASTIASTQAAPLEPTDVAAGAKWVVHIDFDAARDSKVGQHIREKALKDEHVQKALAKLQDEIGMDPRKDLHGATLYGTSFTPHTGVLIIYAVADKDKLMSHLKSKPDFIALKTDDGNRDMYTWTEHIGRDQKHTVWASFPKDGMGVFADSAVDLKAALEVIDGKAARASSPLLLDATAGTVFSGVAAGLTEAHLPAGLPLAKQIQSVRFAAGESDRQDFDHIKVELANADVANQVKSIIAGFQAMGDLRFADHPEALKLINALKIDADGKILTIDWTASSDDVISFVDKAREIMQEHRQNERR